MLLQKEKYVNQLHKTAGFDHLINHTIVSKQEAKHIEIYIKKVFTEFTHLLGTVPYQSSAYLVEAI